MFLKNGLDDLGLDPVDCAVFRITSDSAVQTRQFRLGSPDSLKFKV